MQNMDENEKIMEKGSFLELLLKLSIPAVVVILIMLLYNMADTFFIGKTGDPDKISAISICMPVFTVLSGIGTLFGIGGGTAISIALGEKQEEKIKYITAFCGVGAVTIGVVIFILLFTFTQPICIFLGADQNTLQDAMLYLRVFSFSGPLVIFSNAYGNILRSDGEAVTAMLANIAGTIFNILGDAVFIMIFHWGVSGAALATVLGNLLSVVLIFTILYQKKRIFLPEIKYLMLKKEIVIPVLTLGLPMTLSTVLNSISGTIQNRLMMKHGAIYLASQSVAGKFGMIIVMLIMGFCMGIQPAISFNYGRKNYKRMYRIVGQITVFSIMLGIVLAGVLFLVKDAAIAAFIDNQEVIAYGKVFLLASVCVGPVCGVYQVCQTFLQATGKASYAIFISLLDKGLFFIPVLFLMEKLFGAYGIAFAHAVTIGGSVVVAVFLALRWKQKTIGDTLDDLKT